ncbi:hypothetical protein M0R45_009122 [Rubus argutus]|uniref:Uncharacterized protein n=1 Tax=Rubus argutus TaxID=59490 RepID=A0AAW1Y727_RUBAR
MGSDCCGFGDGLLNLHGFCRFVGASRLNRKGSGGGYFGLPDLGSWLRFALVVELQRAESRLEVIGREMMMVGFVDGLICEWVLAMMGARCGLVVNKEVWVSVLEVEGGYGLIGGWWFDGEMVATVRRLIGKADLVSLRIGREMGTGN